MKTMQMIKCGILVAVTLLVSVPSIAQYSYRQEQQTVLVSAPSSTFRSTGSTMMSTGSAYSANPTLNADGTAAYNGASYAPAQAPGVRKGHTPNPKDPTPLGDAVLPLLLLAGAYIIIRATRKGKA